MMWQRFNVAFLIYVSISLAVAVPTTADVSVPISTPVIVRVVASHAMALGDNVGGAAVTIRDVETGVILARGQQSGPSGDAKSIMQTPHLHIEPVFSVRESASFTAELQLSKPTLVEVVGEGPLKFPQAIRRASRTVLLYPGKAVTGDGIILELNGLLVNIEAPTAERPLGIGDEGILRATVKMLCGCIVEPLGNWDSRKMDLYGELRLGEKVIQRIDVYHQGPRGLFTGNFTIPRSLKGEQTISLRVVAADADAANIGIDEVTYPLVPWEQSRDATGREIPVIADPKNP
jgi:hypothetical protein